jgi:hypothetical protein
MKAFITLLSTPDYLPGVLCLARSLRDTGTQFPLYVALSHGATPQMEAALHREHLPTLRLPAESPLPRNLEQPAAQPVATEAPQQTPVQAQQAGFGLGFGQPQAQAPTQEEPQTTYASGSYANSPGYDSRFGRPVR